MLIQRRGGSLFGIRGALIGERRAGVGEAASLDVRDPEREGCGRPVKQTAPQEVDGHR
jgi:hypothetical protein